MRVWRRDVGTSAAAARSGPMSPPILDDPKLCYRRASEARRLAADTSDRELQQLMVELAEEYETAGREAEGHSRSA
jgi:hypothetical protein